jgi:GWxTD domain-containing protein
MEPDISSRSRNKIIGYRQLFFILLLIFFFVTAFIISSFADVSSRQYYDSSVKHLADGDTARAISQLNRALEQNRDHSHSLIVRGELLLAAGKQDKARQDFERVLHCDSDNILYRAHLGLGDCFRAIDNKNLKAVAEYRQALKYYPKSKRAMFSIANAGFALGETSGFRLASQMLVALICIDPEYEYAYDIWRKRIHDQTADELRAVDSALTSYLASHPRRSAWWLDLAWDRYGLGEIGRAESALAELDRLGSAFKLPDRQLLSARCLLERGDTLGFETAYNEALGLAEEKGGFGRLFIEVQPILTPREKEDWYDLRYSKDVAVLFRKFWKSRDPDPLTFRNERLVTHYVRLREAETYYRQLFPHSRFQTSRDYFKLLSPSSRVMEYDPEIFRTGNRQLPLDQRGMLYIRHGPPKSVSKPDITQKSNSSEIWYYEDRYFSFERVAGAGDFLFMPLSYQGAGDIKVALTTDSFLDPLPQLAQEYYAAEFMGQYGELEIEFYQSVPADVADSPPSRALAAVYDTTWLELARDTAEVLQTRAGRQELWVAVNRISLPDTIGIFSLVMDLPGWRVTASNSFDMVAYTDMELDLSGVILGTPPVEGGGAHSRQGIEIVPRPSLNFVRGEIVRVYFEIYGLSENREGERQYAERITVSQSGRGSEGIRGFFGGLFGGGGKGKSLAFNFERELADTSEVAAEYFDIDSSELPSGDYRIKMEIDDNNSGDSQKVEWVFSVAKGDILTGQ